MKIKWDSGILFNSFGKNWDNGILFNSSRRKKKKDNKFDVSGGVAWRRKNSVGSAAVCGWVVSVGIIFGVNFFLA